MPTLNMAIRMEGAAFGDEHGDFDPHKAGATVQWMLERAKERKHLDVLLPGDRIPLVDPNGASVGHIEVTRG